MGIPGLIITEDMVPRLQDMLIFAGIKVEIEGDSKKQEILRVSLEQRENQTTLQIPAFHFHCENKDGERVKLTFGRFPSEPFNLVIAIRPQPQSLWKTFIKRKRNKLVDQVIRVLKGNGAREFEDRETNVP